MVFLEFEQFGRCIRPFERWIHNFSLASASNGDEPEEKEEGNSSAYDEESEWVDSDEDWINQASSDATESNEDELEAECACGDGESGKEEENSEHEDEEEVVKIWERNFQLD